MSEPNRYAGKPLLRLLECYVLSAIGMLDPADQEKLTALAPQLSRVYRKTGTWIEILAAEMELPDQLPSLIARTWQRNQEIASANGIELSPQQFAEMFVDQNLAK
jgi:hypothetical protein